MATPEPATQPAPSAPSSSKPKSARRAAEESNPDFHLPGIGNYLFVKTLGEGNFAKVKLAKHKMTGQEVAIKIIDKTQLEEKKIAKLYREVRIMKMLHHPNIVRLYEVIETKCTVFLVMEYSSGGELYDYLVVHGRMKEKEARAKFRQILSAMSYCHKKRIIHRDLKAENLLMDGNLDIKIADFGFSNQFDPEGKLDTFCGSPPYAAPELFQGRRYVGPEVDIWSLGVILYVLTTGCLPFDGKNLVDMREAVCRGRYRIPFYLTDGCEKLLRKLLVRDSSKRASLEMLIDDSWIMEGYSTSPINVDVSAKVAEDDNLVRMISQKFGITQEVILRSLRENVFDDISALYYLMYHERDRTGDYSRVNQVLSASSPTSPSVLMPLSPSVLPTPTSSPDKVVPGSPSTVIPDLDPPPESKKGAKIPSVDTKGSTQSANESPPQPKSAITAGIASTLSRVSAVNGSRRRRFTMGGGEKKPETASKENASAAAAPAAPAPAKEAKPKTHQTSALGAVLTAVRGERKSSAKAIEEAAAPNSATPSGGPTKPESKEEPFRKRNNTIAGIFSTFTRAGRIAHDSGATSEQPALVHGNAGADVNTGSPPADEEMKPRVMRFSFSTKSTSEMQPKDIRAELQRVLGVLGITYKMSQQCVAECSFTLPHLREPGKFEVEICRLPGLKTHGLRFNRLSGNPTDYKQVLETLLDTLKL